MADLFSEKLLSEICQNGRLMSYRETIRDILTLIYQDGLTVSPRYDVTYSNIEPRPENKFHIRLSLLSIVNPLDVIWILLHEYGHFLSGTRQKEDITKEREELAWLKIEELLPRFPELLALAKDYESCKQRCLDTYRKLEKDS